MQKKLFYKLVLITGVIVIMAFHAFPLDRRINLGLDLKGGMHLLLRVDIQGVSAERISGAVDQEIAVLRDRILDKFGTFNPMVQKQGENEIIVQLPGVIDREGALELISQTAFLEFKLVLDDKDKLLKALEGDIPDGYELKYSIEDNEPLLLEKQAVLTGKALENAYVRFDSNQFGQPIVALEFNPEGARTFAEVTADNVGRRLAIVLDGKTQSAPRIREAIPSGEAIISGRFTAEKASGLARILNNPLPLPIVLEEERTVGPLLGQDSIRAGLKASIIGLSLVFIFMIVYYLFLGLIANIALLMNLLFIFGGLGILPVLFPGVSATLTLPGIAGIVLSLGMAVDANVLINERMREELGFGRPILLVISNGYNKALSAIVDSNLTTLIAAFLLFQFGTGPIRGFAVTLTIGLLSSMFTALIVTRTILEIAVRNFKLKKLVMMRLIRSTHIDFIAKRKVCYLISLVVIIAGLIMVLGGGRDSWGIDFTGGRVEEYRFDQPVPLQEVRRHLADIGEENASIQQFRDNPEIYLIKTASRTGEDIGTSLKQAFSDRKIDLLKVESVGPIAGRHLRSKAASALFWAIIGILIYVTFRFKHFNFAIAGIIALFHDCLITLGFMGLTGRQIDLITITAILSIAGYSINDTIVIYDRLRENRKIMQKLKLSELINLSINQTLSRTLVTTFTTLLVVVALLIWGGSVLSNFAFALFVGFIAGTYSTIFIVSPLVLVWNRSINTLSHAMRSKFAGHHRPLKRN
ncbi:MAG: protein translocase subunit SecD [Candidatus Omnitrophota bacterium]